MKTLNIAITAEAHKNLKDLVKASDDNQSDVVSNILEKMTAEKYMELMQ